MKARQRQKLYFEIILKKDYDTECWTPSDAQDYYATVRLFNKYGQGRTYEQFLGAIVQDGRKCRPSVLSSATC